MTAGNGGDPLLEIRELQDPATILSVVKGVAIEVNRGLSVQTADTSLPSPA